MDPEAGQRDTRDAKSPSALIDAAVTGLRWMSGVRLLSEVVGLVTMVVLARLIPPSEFGKYVITLIISELALGVLGESVGSALIQRSEVRREHLQVGQVVCVALALALTGATLLLAPLVVTPLFGGDTASLTVLSTPLFVLVAIGTVPTAMLQRRLDFRRIGLIQMATLVVRAVTAVALAGFAGMDAEALVLAGLAAGVTGTGIALASVRVPRARWHRSAARELAGYGAPAGVAAISWIGFRNADYAIVGARLGLTSTGIFWRAYQLAVEYQKKISTLLLQIGFPVLSRTASVEDMFALRLRMVRVTTVTIFPLLTGLVLMAPVLIPWLFGPAWTPAVVPTQILVVAGATILVIDAVGTTLMAAGRPRALLAYGWSHFAVYATTVFLVAPMGVVAVCAGAGTVHLVFLFVAYGVLLRGHVERPLRQLWSDVAPASVSSLALLGTAAPVMLALDTAGVPAALELGVGAIVAGAAYCAALRTLFPESWRDVSELVRRVLPDRLSRRARRQVALAARTATPLSEQR